MTRRARGEVNLPLFMKKITTGMSSQIGGRMISSGDRLGLIEAKNNKIETAIEKLRNKLLGAQMHLGGRKREHMRRIKRRPGNDEMSQRRKLTGHGKLRRRPKMMRSRWDDNRLS